MIRSHRIIRGLVALALGIPALASLLIAGPAAAADTVGGAYILAANNQIARVLDSRGDLLTAAQTVTGVATGEQLVAIAIRPLNNRLYGLASNGAGAVRLYHIDSGSGAPIATPLSDAPVQFSDGTAPVAIAGSAFDINFNPTVDRIRVISTSGTNFRMNPNNGTIVDGDTVAPGVNSDGALKGGATTANATAYTNSFVNATATTLYTLDSGSNKLFIQNPPNNGTLTSGVDVKLGGNVLDFSDAALDIPSSVAVSAANAPAAGLAYAVLKVDNADSLYTLDLTSGTATLLGNLGTLTILDIALAPVVPVGIALTADSTQLQRFRLDQPNTLVTAPISGVISGDILAGIDGRPATGQTFGLGVNAAANLATLYLIDPQTGVATVVGTGGIGFVDAAGSPVDLPDVSAGYGLDFNPTVDRLRVVTGTGLNFRINPLTGAAVDGDATAVGVNTDGAIKGAATGVTATAYTNNFTGATVTTLYTLDSATDKLLIQNPPNGGVETNALAVQLNGKTLDFSAVNGFDIPTTVIALAANAPVTSGVSYAALTVGGSTSLYQINLVTGAATTVGTVGTGATGAGGLVVWTAVTAPVANSLFLPLVSVASNR